MSAPDCFLVAWWLAAAAVGIAIVVIARQVGAGSGMILAADDDALQPIERSRRN
jgi:hypothetical protein